MPALESPAAFEQLPGGILLDNPHGSSPLRAQVFGTEHLEGHARQLGELMKQTRIEAGRPLLSRFLDNARSLQQSHLTISRAYQDRENLGHDAEWLLDNYHIIADALIEIRTDLPRDYYHLLPKLVDGSLKGFPRVYALALELTAHTDSSLDEANVSRFIQAFQSDAPLTIGELWAVPIMLRLCLADNLRRLAEQVVQYRAYRKKAQAWVTANLPSIEQSSGGEHFALDDLHPDWRDCYVVHLLEDLHGHELAFPAAAERLKTCLERAGHTASDVLRREQERQAANQVSIGNCVTSLRVLSALDWSRFFERTSLLEASLRQDPAGIYAKQDFATRDRYRQRIEHLSRRSRLSELEVARTVLDMAGSSPPETSQLQRHIGYYLVDEGRAALEARVGYRAPASGWLKRRMLAHPQAWYFGGLAFFTVIFLMALAWVGLNLGAGAGPIFLLLMIALIPASELAVGLMNFLVPAVIPPRPLVRMDHQSGLPPDCATFVVIPSLLANPQSAASLVDRLEIHYLSNSDEHMYFGLLTDFVDAATETTPGDAACLKEAEEGIHALNMKYAAPGHSRFFLLHRHRQWNHVQSCWMGWERKRGKLAEFNRLLRHDQAGSFSTVVGDLANLPRIRFVITLDSDTQLPREAARKLIATLAHPLNQPHFDPVSRRVVRGYGVLQPRIGLSMRGASKSWFARIFSGSVGLDPYTTAVSDTYQDLFGSGSFTGKGIYDLDAFESATGEVFPENRVLSHDLIEGNFARCGLVSDVELLDDFPSHFLAYARREHRWARGDWQILPWLFNTLPTPNGQRLRNPLPLLERWKIFDNLRRTFVAPSLVVLLLVGWTTMSGAWWWTGLAALVLAWPLILSLAALPFHAVRHWLKGKPGFPPVGGLASTAGQVLLSGIFLLEQARNMLDACGRTLYRRFISRKYLLEWETAATVERRAGTGLRPFLLTMWPSALAALGVAAILIAKWPASLPAASPFLSAWFFAPLVACVVSQRRQVAESAPNAEDRATLRRWSRKTWSFFETFVSEHDHWLPPDNYQLDPKGEIAHRTSPTNIGLYLLSSVAAHDLGYLSLAALIERLENTMASLEKMERAHGHFYNWYDTETLAPLHPIYLSTVDSGNLAASFVTLKQSLLEKIRAPLWGAAMAQGLSDTLNLVAEQHRAPIDRATPDDKAVIVATDRIRTLQTLLQHPPGTDSGWPAWVERVTADCVAVLGDAERLKFSEESLIWARRLADLARERDIEFKMFGCTDASEPNAAAVGTIIDRLTLEQLMRSSNPTVAEATLLWERCLKIADRADSLAAVMDFRVLYNPDRDLFAVGYNMSAGRIDTAHYDLLASESCLTSFLTVARGDVPKKHWFHLGRPVTRVKGAVALLSWGGTMFEYLMPRLFLHLYPETLLDESHRAAVAAQIQYGRQCRTPWGISESAYNAVDGHLNYQYQAFGVPELGLKRGLGQDLVVAPYATGLAVMIAPREAVRNYKRLCDEGAEGPYGLFEAIDYTADRLPENRTSAIVKCVMAHHQGMTLIAIVNRLLGDPVPRRFHAEPMVRATELLLQERVPHEPPSVERQPAESALRPSFHESSPQLSRRLTTPHTAHPRTHMLASERYSLMITNAGSGQSSARGLAVTRWREDRTCDAWGQFYYVRDLRTGQMWSAGHQPLRKEADEYEVTFATDKVVFRRVDDQVETRMEITISPENHAEVRRLTFTNHDSRSHYLEITSYAEIVLATQAADLAHAVFGELFLETEFIPASEALLCRRRPRTPEEKPIWALHVLAAEGQTFGGAQFETDRARFLGRGRSTANPHAIEREGPLSGTSGPVLDAIFSLRRRIRVKSGAAVSLAFTTALADSREEALALADHFHDDHGIHRAFELAWAHGQVELRHLHLTAEQTHLFQRLAAHLWYAEPAFRAPSNILSANRQGQSGLWRHGISGDLPIMLVFIADAEELPLARQLIAAHTFWRLKGLAADLVMINEQDGGYFEDFQEQIEALVRASDDRTLLNKSGGVHLLKATHLSSEDGLLLQAAARCMLLGSRGPLTAQLDRLERQRIPIGKRVPVPMASDRTSAARHSAVPESEPLFDNGIGGFTANGKEYVVRLPFLEGGHVLPPQPWINVIANPTFGTVVSENGGGFTWRGNSQSNRLTPWRNDPVSDVPGEIIYLRDERTGQLWTATPQPLGAPEDFRVRHGQGYTVFEHTREKLIQELTVFVPRNDPVKILRLKIRNTSDRAQRLSVAYFAELVLGRTRDQTGMQIVTEIDPATGAVRAKNAFRPDEAEYISFADMNVRPRTFTCDRTEFLGRNGHISSPAALERGTLSGKCGAGLDPCAALHGTVIVNARGESEIIFILGEAKDAAEVQRLVRIYQDPVRVQAAWVAVNDFWERFLTTVEIKTPDAALDTLFNRWLPYQVLSCRMWARSALYQSGGAYGFRDQLQDSLALVYAFPDEARRHILRASAHQFVEGDVQHWWHPPSNAGVRTRFSDDFLWLPFVVEHYVRVTGDRAILDERVSYLRAPRLGPGQDEDYRVPNQSDESGTVYEHCLKAIDNGFHLGAHGLPLMGTGDWNDGMNRVGSEGRGESVWVGWFLAKIFKSFAAICDSRNDPKRGTQYRDQAEQLRTNLEGNAWDGEWYRRAYFDDGTPLGSATNDECSIDSLTQSWAVISGEGEPERAQKAMSSADRKLVRRDDKLVLLFTPPFDHGPLQPGYIKGYLPGIRENGGQYTHAALWVAQAFALLGQGDKAMEVLDLLNPIRHAMTREAVERFRVEPYVVPADVYSQPPHVGRGGWSWYTGSAAWFYRVVLETLLGFEQHGAAFRLQPRIPVSWPGFNLTYRHRSSTYRLRVENVGTASSQGQSIQLDGVPQSEPEFPLLDDGKVHDIFLRLKA